MADIIYFLQVPPGTGKTLLASRLPGILPMLTEQEALEVAAIYSIADIKPLTHWPQRPFRAPHHTSSAAALVGGGSKPQPGEVTLAHQGVLFLDEFTEFDRRVLEVLREPLESHEIMVARAREKVLFPAKFQLIAAMNPCPCGYLGDITKTCRCTPEQVQRYRGKLSGPLLDRIDLHITVGRESLTLSTNNSNQLTSAEAAKQVAQAREIQQKRQGCPNAYLDIASLQQVCQLSKEDQQWFEQAGEKLGLSLRALHRCLKVARTLADMQGEEKVKRSHLAEVFHYRPST